MSNHTASSAPRHPIRVVAERTGLTPATLRAWERRHGVVDPGRSAGAQRLYSDLDIERLRLISDLSAVGYSLSQLSTYTTATLTRMARQSPGAVAASDTGDPASEGRTHAAINRLLALARVLDSGALRAALTQVVFTLGPSVALETIVSPFLGRLGAAWSCGDVSIAQEHLASGVVRDTLGWMLQTAAPSDEAPTFVATCVAGEQHEFGAMMAAVAATIAGWRVLYLGANLPAGEIARATKLARAHVVGLSIVNPQPSSILRDELTELRAQLGKRTVVLAGGAAVYDHRLSLRRASIEIVESRSALTDRLAKLRKR